MTPIDDMIVQLNSWKQQIADNPEIVNNQEVGDLFEQIILALQRYQENRGTVWE